MKEYDRSRIKAGKTRIKEWDYYLIHNDRFGVALTVADNSYMGLVSISFPVSYTHLDVYKRQVVSWYDNENSYVSQMVRTIKYFSELA